MEAKDLATCRSVRYTKSWRRGAVKCGECGFWFVPDAQAYPIVDHGDDTCDGLSGVDWFKQFKCCPNCLPAVKPEAPFGKRRCLGRDTQAKGHAPRWGCGVLFVVGSHKKLENERTQKHRLRFCLACNTGWRGQTRMTKTIINKCQTLYRRMHRMPTVKEWNRAVGASYGVVEYHFGHMADLAHACGFEPNPKGPVKQKGRPPQFTRGDAVTALHLAYQQRGHALTRKEWKALGLKPCESVIIKLFGTWNNASLAIGVTPNKSVVENTPDENRRYGEMGLRAQGQHPDQIAERARKLEEAINYQCQKLAEAERKFKEHQFKRKEE